MVLGLLPSPAALEPSIADLRTGMPGTWPRLSQAFPSCTGGATASQAGLRVCHRGSRWEQSGILFTATVLEGGEQLLRSSKPKPDAACHLLPRLPSVPSKGTSSPQARPQPRLLFPTLSTGNTQGPLVASQGHWLLISRGCVFVRKDGPWPLLDLSGRQSGDLILAMKVCEDAEDLKKKGKERKGGGYGENREAWKRHCNQKKLVFKEVAIPFLPNSQEARVNRCNQAEKVMGCYK